MPTQQKNCRVLPEKDIFDSGQIDFPDIEIRRLNQDQVEHDLEDLNFKEFGSLPSIGDIQLPKSRGLILNNAIDLREQFKFPPIRDQGDSKTCSAFALASLIEFEHSQLSGSIIELSVGWMHTCIGNRSLYDALSFDILADKLKHKLIPTVKPEYPWDDTTCDREGEVFMPELHKKGMNKYSTSDAKYIIQSGRPFVSALRINKDFLDWNSDQPYTYNPELDWGTHAILVIGFSDKHWICRNSYGRNWGDGTGYFRVNFSDCRLCDGRYSLFSVPEPDPFKVS